MKDHLKILFILCAGVVLSASPYLPANPTTTNMLAAVAREKASGGGSSLPPASALIAWWDFDNRTTGEGNDDAHSTNDFTEVGPPVYQTASAPYYGTSSVSSTHLWYETGTATSWGNAAGDWTLVARFKTSDANTDPGYVLSAKGNITNIRVNNFAGGGWGRVNFKAQNMTTASSAADLSETGWRAVAMTWNDTTNTFEGWHKGTKVATGTAGTPSYGTTSLKAGGSSESAADLNGDFDYVGIFNRVLTDTEIQALNDGGALTYGDLP